MKAVETLFDSLRRKPAAPAIDASSWKSYRSLLVALADGLEVDPAAAADILQDIGKSQRDVERDAQVMRQRLDAFNRLERADDASKELVTIDAKLAKADSLLERAKGRHAETVTPLREERFQLQSRVDAIESAERTLRRTIIDPGLKAEIKAIEATKRELQSRINDIAEELRLSNVGSVANRLTADRDTLAKIEAGEHGAIRRGSDDHRKLSASIEQLSKRAAALESQRAKMTAEQDQLSSRLDALRDKGLTP